MKISKSENGKRQKTFCTLPDFRTGILEQVAVHFVYFAHHYYFNIMFGFV